VYSIVLFILLYSYFRIDKSKLARQKRMFHALLLISVSLKIIYLVMESVMIQNGHSSKAEEITTSILARLSGYLFLLTFCLLLILWARISNIMSDMVQPQRTTLANIATKKPAPTLDNLWNLVPITIFVCISLSIVTVGVIFRLLQQSNEIQTAALVFDCGLNFGCAFGYLFYGWRLSNTTKLFPIHSNRKSQIIKKIVMVTALCFICFLARSSLLIRELTECKINNCPHNHSMVLLEIIFFSVGEIFPIITMLFITHHKSDDHRESRTSLRTKLFSENETNGSSPRSSKAFKMTEPFAEMYE